MKELEKEIEKCMAFAMMREFQKKTESIEITLSDKDRDDYVAEVIANWQKRIVLEHLNSLKSISFCLKDGSVINLSSKGIRVATYEMVFQGYTSYFMPDYYDKKDLRIMVKDAMNKRSAKS